MASKVAPAEFVDTIPDKTGGTSMTSLKSKDGDEVTLTESTNEVKLGKNMGLVGGISFIIGTMIGSGIFVSPKGVLSGAKTVGGSLIVWVLGGFVSMMGALSYAELGTMITRSGGEYAYLIEAFHPVFAYLFVFIQTLMLKPSSVAIISLTCGEYLAQPFFDDGCGKAPEIVVKFLAFAVVLTCALVNVMSAKLATKVQIVFTGAKLIALAIIIVGGFVKLGQGFTDHLGPGAWDPIGGSPTAGSIALGFYSGMWAYDGWNNLNLCTEELEDAHRNLPLAIFIGIPLVTIVYLLTNISYFTVLSPQALLDSPAVAISWAEHVMPNFAWTIPIFVALSTFGACNGTLFASGRLVFTAGREGHMIKVLSFVNVKRFTPAPAIMFTVLVALFMLIPSDIETLIDFFSFAAWMFYAIVFCALLYLRYRSPNAPRPYKVPIVCPIIALLIAVFLVFTPIISDPQMAYLYAGLFILAGLIFYVPFIHYRKELPFMESFNIFFQLFLEVVPPPEYDGDALDMGEPRSGAKANGNAIEGEDNQALEEEKDAQTDGADTTEEKKKDEDMSPVEKKKDEDMSPVET